MSIAKQLKKIAELIEQEMDVCEIPEDLEPLEEYHQQIIKAKRDLSAKSIKENTDAYAELSKSFAKANSDLKEAIDDIKKIGKRTERIGKIVGQVCEATVKAIELIS